ncbi:M23 family metallopeptidase [Angustibacter peucedani]
MPFPRLARAGVSAVCLTLVGTLVTPAVTANAGPEDRKRKVDSSIRSLQDDLEDTSSDLRSAYFRLKATREKVPAAQAALATAQARLVQAQAHHVEVGQKLEVAKAREGKAADDLARTQRVTRTTNDTLGSLARQAYQSGGVGELSVTLQASSADDFAQRVTFLDRAMQVQGVALAQLEVARAETTAKRARLVAVRREVALLKAQAEAAVDQAAVAQSEASTAKRQLETLQASLSADARNIRARRASEKERLDALEAESKKLRIKLAAIARAQRAAQRRAGRSSSGGPSGGYLSRPVAGGYISSEFGLRFHPILHYWRLHAGMDFAVPCGTPVRAAASGRILSAGWGGGYGNRIVVTHGVVKGVGLFTTYNHLSRFVKTSGHVERGQLIAYSGTTGASTGCHLHFETYDNGTPVNPRRWL